MTLDWFNGYIRAGDLPDEKHQQYLEAAAVLFARMTPTALRRVRQHVRHVELHESLEALTVAVAGDFPEVRQLVARGIYAGGAYNRFNGHLDLDGKDDLAENDAVLGHYAHEFGHVLDGPERRLSESPDWLRAWHQEIRPQVMTVRALDSPQEALAEFARLMYTGVVWRRELERRYSLCVSVWKGSDLW